ncbi:MAG: hypothetical protein KDC42_11255 [Ignavibacteriae bacterium]|nr:hypothetical protein [Ignavibacteriota bacterium]
MKIFSLSLIYILLASLNASSQVYNEYFDKRDFSVTTSVNYVTSASIQLNPNSTDIIEQNQIEELHGGISYGLSIKKKMFGDDIMLGLSAEYLHIEDDNQKERVFNGASTVNLRVTEIITVLPVELSVYYKLPKFTESFNLLLGGGMGVYFGTRERKILNLQTETNSTEQALNFHIITAAEYIISRHLSAVADITFREGEYRVDSSFPTNRVRVNGTTYMIQQNYDSKIFIDGLKLGLGLSYYFN